MRRTRVLLAVVVLTLAWASAGVIYAITNGQPDGTAHPYVGVLVFYVPNQNEELEPAWFCSGSLIAPTVVLTAGHCTDGAAAARVWRTVSSRAARRRWVSYAPVRQKRASAACASGLDARSMARLSAIASILPPTPCSASI